MQRYESYKASGVESIREIPAHWNIKKNKFLFSEQKDVVGENSASFKLLSLTLQGVILRDMENPKGKFPAEFNTYKIVAPNDLIFCLFDVEETPRTVGRAVHHGMITGAYTVVRCNEKVSSPFAYYYYLSLDNNKQLRPLYTGLRNVITSNAFFSLAMPIPPIAEQVRIVKFLDQKTSEIDAAIDKKKRLLELLQEQKRILINRAVTNGLSMEVPRHQSGIAWAGIVPTHWDIRYLKHIFKEIDHRSNTGKEVLYSLRMSGQLVRHHDVSDKPITADQLIGYKLVQPGQLVMNRMRASMGLFAIANEHGLVSPDYAVFDPIVDVVQEYFLALFRNSAIQGVFLTESKGLGTGSSGFLRLYSDRFGGIKVPCPPLAEQKEIVAAIHSIQEQFKKVERPVEVEIDNLQEMRTTLIATTVTGQIRV
ncbi:restriction endonuclease subunit S [Acidovorax sp. Leaf78]|uniref:restriction endonuclease subunit S n=1 Tax=Acidovorax sp. Leaf78 TaxID=1736237 RepID=UPI0009E6960C|nr:restriction endonuclease subunit S [Acidovorax sp. Leaf78]